MKHFFDDFRWQMKLKGENIQKATSEMASIDTGHGEVTNERIRTSLSAIHSLPLWVMNTTKYLG